MPSYISADVISSSWLEEWLCDIMSKPSKPPRSNTSGFARCLNRARVSCPSTGQHRSSSIKKPLESFTQAENWPEITVSLLDDYCSEWEGHSILAAGAL